MLLIGCDKLLNRLSQAIDSLRSIVFDRLEHKKIICVPQAISFFSVPKFYQNSTNILPKFYQNSTKILPNWVEKAIKMVAHLHTKTTYQKVMVGFFQIKPYIKNKYMNMMVDFFIYYHVSKKCILSEFY
jgi:hypothetical protein